MTASDGAGSWAQTLYLALLLIVAPTAGLFLLGQRLGFLSPPVNLDLFIVYALTVVAGRFSMALALVLGVFGTAAVLFVQVMIGVGLIYVDDPALIREYLSFAKYWPWRLIGSWAMVAAIGLAFLWLLLWRLRIGQARIAPMILVLAAALALDLAGRTAVGYAAIKTNLATSSTVRGVKMLRAWSTSKGFVHTAHPGQSMAGDLNAMPAPPPRILSVSIESLGLAQDPAFNAAITAPLQQTLASDYLIQPGSHVFKGATLSGEIRELCGLRSSGTPTRVDGLEIRKDCVSAKLAAKGYKSLAIHGNSKFFYNRGELYPAMGFTQTLAYEEMIAENRKICRTRAFAGVCDSEALAAALRFLGANPKAFAHVMTLDTHFPLGETVPGDQSCASTPGLERPELCLYANQQARVMATIADAVRDAPVKPDLIYIYGDHAPPYTAGADRAFFEEDRVPFLTLSRR